MPSAVPVELILLRQWATYVGTPVILLDRHGMLLLYNEAAEQILGRPFADAEELPIPEGTALLQLRTESGQRLAPHEQPLGVAHERRQPSHQRLRIRSLDGSWRLVEMTAVPLTGQGSRYLGVLGMFWEVEGPQ